MNPVFRKIVFVSPYGHKHAQSGARKRAECLSSEMARNFGFEAVCLSPWPSSDGVAHVPFCMDGSILRRLFSVLRLHWLLFRLRPDFVVSESPIAPFSFGFYKVFHVIHDAKFVSKFARFRGGLVYWMHWISARIANKVLTVSNSEATRIASALQIDIKKICVSYNGLSDAWFHRNGGGESKLYDILYVSNFAPHKGHMDLLRSLIGLNLKVAFVGADFSEKEKCLQFSSENKIDLVVFEGLSEDDLISIYDSSRVFAFPSKLEGFGIPFLEARARGISVLANDIPVFRELSGLLGGEIVDFSDSIAVIAHLRGLLENETSDSRVSNAFNWRCIAEKLVDVMK